PWNCGATVGGGQLNSALASFATVAGGQDNKASGVGSMVAGGFVNQANGEASFAAGVDATANNDNSFVWSGGAYYGLSDTGPGQFVAAAPGGFFFYTSIWSTVGATLPSGSGSWNSLSDRNVKENFSDIDGKALLAKLASLPILTWNYKAQSTSIRHMGPTAQDFHEAFNLGEDEKHISTVDAQGVALAAIQELYKITQQKDGKIAELEQ